MSNGCFIDASQYTYLESSECLDAIKLDNWAPRATNPASTRAEQDWGGGSSSGASVSFIGERTRDSTCTARASRKAHAVTCHLPPSSSCTHLSLKVRRHRRGSEAIRYNSQPGKRVPGFRERGPESTQCVPEETTTGPLVFALTGATGKRSRGAPPGAMIDDVKHHT